jgi:Protein of unknown function (DUF3300)
MLNVRSSTFTILNARSFTMRFGAPEQKKTWCGKEKRGMKMKRPLINVLAVLLALLLGAPQGLMAQSEGGDKPFKQEELDQLAAPIALYPDSLLAQILMASTYPLEVVQAGRWAKTNQSLKGDALAAALEKQDWDPSVKSLVNFPQVLDMMNEKLDWTQKMGDAFLAQQKDVMDTVQKLRLKAYGEGNLKSTEQQKVVVEEEQKTIIIEPAKPEVVYVPTYNPTVVYGAWPYPSYPPYYYYPPGYVPGAALFSFGMGVAMGAAWGYAWGNCNWRGGDVNVNVNQNTNINNSIDRSKYQNKVTTGQGGKGEWKHDPEHRKGASYRDQGTADKFGKGASTRDAQSRDAYRGRDGGGRQDISQGAGDRSRGGQQMDRGGASAGQMDRGSALSGMDRGGSATRDSSSRGNQSMSSSRGGGGGGSSMSRGSGGGGGGGGSRGGGGGGRGGGGGGGGRGGGGRR